MRKGPPYPAGQGACGLHRGARWRPAGQTPLHKQQAGEGVRSSRKAGLAGTLCSAGLCSAGVTGPPFGRTTIWQDHHLPPLPTSAFERGQPAAGWDQSRPRTGATRAPDSLSQLAARLVATINLTLLSALASPPPMWPPRPAHYKQQACVGSKGPAPTSGPLTHLTASVSWPPDSWPM